MQRSLENEKENKKQAVIDAAWCRQCEYKSEKVCKICNITKRKAERSKNNAEHYANGR